MHTDAVRTNDRVVIRDRPWIVRQVTKVADSHSLLKLEALDDDKPSLLSVSVPPEQPRLLPTEDLAFELQQLDSLTSWSNSHRILATTLVRETGLLSGARFGRVALEAYQAAPALRLIAKPPP